MEIILKIEDFSESGWDGNEGVKITTNKQIIELGISNYSNCCENWDYLMSEDDYDYFIGAEIYGIEEDFAGINDKTAIDFDLDRGASMFIDIKTSKGVLQFVCYNSHNGYYSHSAYVKSNQLNGDWSL